MKKILLLLVVMMHGQITINAQTNSYIPFPKQAVWQIVKFEDYSGKSIKTFFNRAMLGDTIINGISYVKYYDPTLKSALRNDSINKKVYCYDFVSKKDTILYDFNLKVGDTVLVTKQAKYWVTEIDSVLLLDGIYHNRYVFSRPAFLLPELSPLIEGLGYSNGNKFAVTDYMSDGSTYYVTVCASANKKILVAVFGVPPSGEYCGAIITDIETQVKDVLTLYPNPTTGRFQLRTGNTDICAVEIINILGKKIYTSELKNEAIEIDITNQPTGVYFMIAYDKAGERTIRKIIKS